MGTKAWVGLAIFICMWTTNLAVAADWSVVPSVTQRSEFNSNLNFSYTNPLSDYIFSLRPAADFNYTTEISQIQGHVGLFAQHYITYSNLDHIDQNYQINGRYQMYPRLNLSLASSYINDTTLTQELLASGLVMSRTPRQAFMVGPGVTYNLTERLNATINYNFNRVLYQAPQYTDYSNHQAGLNFTYLLKDEKTSLISNNVFQESLYAGGNTSESIGIYGGVARKFSERWDATLMTGVNINFYSFNTQVQNFIGFPYFVIVPSAKRIHSSSVTPYVNVSTRYRWTNFSVSAGASRSQSPSAYGAIYEFNRIYANCAYNISERLSASLNGSYSLSNVASQSTSSEYDYFNISPQLTYRITEKLSASTGYNFSNSASLTEGGGSGHVHTAWIQFSYTYPIHYQK
jgi:hypothetical protein